MYVKIIRKNGRKNRTLIDLAGLTRRRKGVLLRRRTRMIYRENNIKIKYNKYVCLGGRKGSGRVCEWGLKLLVG